jgi:hypothetical protein
MSKSAQTINEFCEDNRICRATYYNLRKSGRGPKIIKIGAKTIITDENAAEWRARMQAETAEREEEA